jgi:hypothetical protein
MTTQRNFLSGLASHNMVSPWTASPRPVFQSRKDKTEQQDMSDCCLEVPYSLHLTDRTTNKRVWFKVYNDAEDLVQEVLDFALTTNPEFYQFALDAYNHWVLSERRSMWDPEMFLEQISQRTYFLWSSTPNFDLSNDEHGWTPAAKEWADVFLQEIIYPADDLAMSAYPEFAFRPSDADTFSHLNNIPILTEILGLRRFMTELRMTRFLTLGLPAVTFAQAVSEQMIPSLHRALDIETPNAMIKWAQDLDLMVITELSQGRKPVEDALMASLTLRNIGAAIIGAEQFEIGVGVYTKSYMSGLL